MKNKLHFVAVSLVLALISVVSAQLILAQHTHDQSGENRWKTGMLRISKSVWAGDAQLKSGMYHVKHVMYADKHMLVFRSVALPGGKGFPMWEEKEVLRLECRVEPVTKSTRNTKVRLGKNAAGESVILEIQIAGEKVRHILT